MCTNKARGFLLVELTVFIVIIGIALAGVLLAVTQATAQSADPLLRKQALLIAESLVDEIVRMPFAPCDLAGCAAARRSEASGERFGDLDAPRQIHLGPGIRDYRGVLVARLEAYSADVAIVPQQFAGIPQEDARRITVTVTGPAGTRVTLEALRTRYPSGAVER